MTYCAALNLDTGMVFCSDSRTNAGIDNVSVYSKMHTFGSAGERFFVLLSAGNLATTQAVVKKLNSDMPNGLVPNLQSVASMQEAADYLGIISTQVQRQQSERDINTNFEASFILGGQIAGSDPELFMIYPQGNCIHESNEHPFLQIGEVKYGKPILDRVVRRDTPLNRAAHCCMVSMNSTIRSNVSVGPPVELLIYQRDQLTPGRHCLYREDDLYARQLAEQWNSGLMSALDQLPPFPWERDPNLSC